MFEFRIFSTLVHLRFPIIAKVFRRSAMTSASPLVNVDISMGPNHTVEENYENAVKALNSLQSNSQTLAKVRQNRDAKRSSSIPQTLGAMITSGITLEAVDSLNIIHVAGSKGKGMTCAFTESILRHAGLKTGFFSSPHLTAVRERIRINGKPLSEDAFARYFFTIYNRLKHLKEENAPFEMPHYFRFLTCMAFHAFLEEKVDAVILEVGIGGTYDTTNVIRKPVVVGITSLCLEHQAILGNTLEEIAIQKAGILKENVSAFTVSSHPPHILDLLHSCANSVKCPLYPVEKLDLSGLTLESGLNDGFVAGSNAGLAIRLANEFLMKKFPQILLSKARKHSQSTSEVIRNSTPLLPFQTEGLKSTKWDGRFQILRVSKQLTYYLDGAHTTDSIAIALKWFQEITSGSSVRILVFNMTGQRSSLDHLKPIAQSGTINLAIFCPLIALRNATHVDNWSALDSNNDPVEDCKKHADIWKSLQTKSQSVVFPDAESVTEYIEQMVDQQQADNKAISVLVTGSLHLVGTFLCVLDPNRNDH